MFLNPIKEGHWYIKSISDPRWDESGEGFVGGGMIPRQCIDAIDRKKKELGNPPSDLEWGYTKY